MRDTAIFAQILGVSSPWQVEEVCLDMDVGEVTVHVRHDPSIPLNCPQCDRKVPGYDFRLRKWRHLDTCQYRTILSVKVPRCNCDKHGIHQVRVPWAQAGSRFTALFEALVIDWLGDASISAVARNLGLSWDQLDGIMQRAVRRGLSRRDRQYPRRLGVDETSFRKHHEYITVVQDQDSGDVVFVSDGRGRESLAQYYESLDGEQLGNIESVAMDMHRPYINATLQYVPDARSKICFDKFHVAKLLGFAVDRVRRKEHAELRRNNDNTLKGTKYIWLQNPANMKPQRKGILQQLQRSSLRTGRAWAVKEFAMSLWDYSSRTWARKAWRKWLSWATRCRLEPVVKAAGSIRRHLWGIINAIVLSATNASSESLNAKIQRIKRMACGFRSRERYRTAIMFHLGGLDLYPNIS